MRVLRFLLPAVPAALLPGDTDATSAYMNSTRAFSTERTTLDVASFAYAEDSSSQSLIQENMDYYLRGIGARGARVQV